MNESVKAPSARRPFTADGARQVASPAVTKPGESGIPTKGEGAVEAVWHFILHVAIGVILFLAVGSASVLLHEFTVWMEARHLDSWMVAVAKWLTWGVFGADAVCFSIFMLLTTWALMVRLWKAGF
jgi:hypothetical protein